MDEASRIRREYEDRDADPSIRDYWAGVSPALECLRAQRKRAVRAALDRSLGVPLSEAEVLEVGIGSGAFMSELESLGVAANRVHGIDLSETRVGHAKDVHPCWDVAVGDATSLPFEACTFNLVVLATVFSSVLDEDVRSSIGAEAQRVLRHDGVMLWYDLRPLTITTRAVYAIEERVLKPLRRLRHPGGRGQVAFQASPEPAVGSRYERITSEQVQGYFPDLAISVRRATTLPVELGSYSGRFRRAWGDVLERLGILNTHWLIMAKKGTCGGRQERS